MDRLFRKSLFFSHFRIREKKNACRMLFVFDEPTPTVFCINIVTKFQEIRRISQGLRGEGRGGRGVKVPYVLKLY